MLSAGRTRARERVSAACQVAARYFFFFFLGAAFFVEAFLAAFLGDFFAVLVADFFDDFLVAAELLPPLKILSQLSEYFLLVPTRTTLIVDDAPHETYVELVESRSRRLVVGLRSGDRR